MGDYKMDSLKITYKGIKNEKILSLYDNAPPTGYS